MKSTSCGNSGRTIALAIARYNVTAPMSAKTQRTTVHSRRSAARGETARQRSVRPSATAAGAAATAPTA